MSEGQKTAVIFGLANKRSIAWAIAQKLHEAGWRLAITYQNERLAQEAKDLITDLPGSEGFMCDVSSDEEIAKLFVELQGRYGVVHGLVHSVAYAPAEELKGEFVNTSREGFRIAHDISVYSLIAVARAAVPLMTEGGGIVTMTYYGRKSRAEVQRDGRGQSGAGSDGAVPFERAGGEEYTSERDFGGADQDAGGARHFATGRDAESTRGAGAVETQCGPGGSGQHGGVSAFGGELGDYRRDAVCGLRI